MGRKLVPSSASYISLTDSVTTSPAAPATGGPGMLPRCGWNPDGHHVSHLPGDSWVPPGLPTTHPCPLDTRELSKAKWDTCHQGICTGP